MPNNKSHKQIKLPILFHTSAPISELPSEISTMVQGRDSIKPFQKYSINKTKLNIYRSIVKYRNNISNINSVSDLDPVGSS